MRTKDSCNKICSISLVKDPVLCKGSGYKSEHAPLLNAVQGRSYIQLSAFENKCCGTMLWKFLVGTRAPGTRYWRRFAILQHGLLKWLKSLPLLLLRFNNAYRSRANNKIQDL